MNIYIAHSREFDYINKLYKPLKENAFLSDYHLIFPHEKENSNNSREFYDKIDILIAECSFPSTGLGIELGFAYDSNIQIFCLHQKNKTVSSSISAITNNIHEYQNEKELTDIIKNIIVNY